MSAPKTAKRMQSLGEEIANSVTHGAGLALSIAAAPVLIVTAARSSAWEITGSSIFAATLIALYLASTIYHATPPSRAKRVLRVVDHGAIFLLIAGTYTPFALGALRGPWGWTLIGIVWALALFGIVLKSVRGFRNPKLSTAVYLGMGWVVVIAVKPLLANVAPAGIAWLLAGGLCYTGGVVFYALDHKRYVHSVWHLFVLAGSACHFAAVWLYSAGKAG